MIIRPQRDPRAVGQTVSLRAHHLPNFAKTRKLRGVLRHIIVSTGEVAETKIDIQFSQHRIAQFGHGQTQPVDPGINHNVAGAPARGQPALHLRQRIEHRPHTAGARKRHIRVIERAVQHRNRSSGHMGNHIGHFAPMRDKPVATARRRQHRHDLRGAQPISIGLYRRPGTRCAAHRIERTPVGTQRNGIKPQTQRRSRQERKRSHCIRGTRT